MSTRGRYGLRAMIELALRHGGPPARLRDIAKCQEIPLAYLRELMTALSARGLVRAVRGPKGGYVLSHPPTDISVKDIIEPLEGSIVLVDCTEDPELCERTRICAARDLWRQLTMDMQSTMSKMMLADLASNQRARLAEEPLEARVQG